MTVTVRRAVAADYPALVEITNVVTPEAPQSVQNMAWADATYPGGVRLLAELDGRPVGAGIVGRIYMFQPDFDAFWADIHVLPDARRRGIGRALFETIREAAREAGKTHLHVPASVARPESIAFLEHRGFAEYDRWKVLALDLSGIEPPAVERPPGVEITSLDARPDLVQGVHGVALATFADIPTGGESIDPGSLAEFRARDVDREEIPHGGFMVALDSASGEAIGYASLMLKPGSMTHGFHDMTAVRREWRGRGVGRALKQATIGWAIGAGLTSLETGNEDRNGPMRALNARLGYVARPDEITFRGPVEAARIRA